FLQFEFFKKLLAVEIKRARRHRLPLSLLLVGLDREPSTRSPPARSLTDAVRSAIRDIDIPVTFSGDNMLVVMPHTDRRGATVVGERIRAHVRTRTGSTSASVAVVATDGLARYTFPSLLQTAARALRSAHRAGGDRVVQA